MKKGFIIAAVVLISLGIILFVSALIASGFDFKGAGAWKTTVKGLDIAEPFHDISVKTTTADVRLVRSDNGACRVVYDDIDDLELTANVENGVLKVNYVDERKWFDRLRLWTPKLTVTVYLPSSTIDRVSVSTTTGDISVSDLSADTLMLIATTGDITASSVTLSGSFESTVTTGDLLVSDLTCSDLTTRGSTGDVKLRRMTVNRTVSVNRSTGDILLSDSRANLIMVKTSTGDVKFDQFDARTISVETTTGDVTGTLLSDKSFTVKTKTGKSSVPSSSASPSDGRCEISTTTGDVKIRIAG